MATMVCSSNWLLTYECPYCAKRVKTWAHMDLCRERHCRKVREEVRLRGLAKGTRR